MQRWVTQFLFKEGLAPNCGECGQQTASSHWLFEGLLLLKSHIFLRTYVPFLGSPHLMTEKDGAAKAWTSLPNVGNICPRAACWGLVGPASQCGFSSLNRLSSSFPSLVLILSKHLAPTFVSTPTSRELNLLPATCFEGRGGIYRLGR